MMPQWYRGRVWHGRSAPQRHHFSYRHVWLAVALDDAEPAQWRLAPGVYWRRRDHGPRDGSPLRAWLLPRLAAAGVAEVGRIELHTMPAVLGYVFNPVSFYLVFSPAGALCAVWAEVSNTFGQHHDYCLRHDDGRAILPGDRFTATKALHVSPFFQVEGQYVFRFVRGDDGRFAVRIEYLRDGVTPDFIATQQGRPVAYSPRQLWQLLLSCGLLTFAVWARIHWQAFRLWRKRVPFFGKNGHAAESVSPGEL